MALELPYGIKPLNPVPVDYWSGPYSGSTTQEAIDAANSGIPSAVRFVSMEASLVVSGVAQKYWYASGTTNSDLVSFSAEDITPYRTYDNITSDFNMTDSSDVVFFDTSSGPININLPTAVGKGGKELLFKFKDGSNSGVLVANGSETIDGNSVFPIYHRYQSITVISDNSNWYVT